jgi:type I restriction enzyme R subunit
MSFKLDEEHYVENQFLAQLQKLDWKIYRQNKDSPEDVRENICFTKDFIPIYGISSNFRKSFCSGDK